MWPFDRLEREWSDVVGPDIASFTRPLRTSGLGTLVVGYDRTPSLLDTYRLERALWRGVPEGLDGWHIVRIAWCAVLPSTGAR